MFLIQVDLLFYFAQQNVWFVYFGLLIFTLQFVFFVHGFPKMLGVPCIYLPPGMPVITRGSQPEGLEIFNLQAQKLGDEVGGRDSSHPLINPAIS